MSARIRLLGSALLLLAGMLLLLGSAPSGAETSHHKFSAPAGITQHQLGGQTVQVNASAPVIVYVIVNGDTVTGAVEPAFGQADVSITLMNDPVSKEYDQLLFHGRVREITWFDSIQPHETGHTEG